MQNSDVSPRLSRLQERLGDVRASLEALENRRDAAVAARDALRRPGPAHPAVKALRQEVADLQSEIEGLGIAMINRGVIEQAKGMLMLRLKVDEAQAFAYLRDMSNRTNRRVAEIAADVVRTRAGETSL